MSLIIKGLPSRVLRRNGRGLCKESFSRTSSCALRSFGSPAEGTKPTKVALTCKFSCHTLLRRLYSQTSIIWAMLHILLCSYKHGYLFCVQKVTNTVCAHPCHDWSYPSLQCGKTVDRYAANQSNQRRNFCTIMVPHTSYRLTVWIATTPCDDCRRTRRVDCEMVALGGGLPNLSLICEGQKSMRYRIQGSCVAYGLTAHPRGWPRNFSMLKTNICSRPREHAWSTKSSLISLMSQTIFGTQTVFVFLLGPMIEVMIDGVALWPKT